MKIEKCPFCGKDVAEITNCKDLEECRHFEKCPATEPYVCVVCNMFEGGCGASSGYYDSAEKAIAAWNRRTDHIRDTTKKVSNADRWIPVTERLPTECGYYLSVVERIAPDELGGNNTRVKIMRWLGADWRYPTHIPKWINEAITETVTHWMPLPATPEKGAEHECD